MIQHMGVHAVHQLLNEHATCIERLYIIKDRHPKLISLAKKKNVRCQFVTQDWLADRIGSHHHQGVLAEARLFTPHESLMAYVDRLGEKAWLLVLDGVQDPHNLGACLRTACAMGVDAVILPKNRACGLTATVHKIACGATSFLPVYTVTNIVRTLTTLQQKGVWCVGTSEHSEQSIQHASLTGPLAIVCGNEEKGLRALTASTCDELVTLPMPGPIKSLNVSVATGMVLWSVASQRD